jgi:hypothetical protein
MATGASSSVVDAERAEVAIVESDGLDHRERVQVCESVEAA